tara:strand:- start:341 stop:985 length:645 start_codon:yes stop_codon:yes gene_type:complete
MTSNLWIKPLRYLIKQCSKVQYACWAKRAAWQSTLNGGSLENPGPLCVRCPVRCDGEGKVLLDEHVTLGYPKAPRAGKGEILLQARSSGSTITIAARTVINNNVSLIANNSITIGTDCLIGEFVSVYDCDFHEITPEKRSSDSAGNIAEVAIGNNVWLGSRAIILKGVTIGENSVIAAGSVVTKSIPPNVVAGGNPATVIKENTARCERITKSY